MVQLSAMLRTHAVFRDITIASLVLCAVVIASYFHYFSVSNTDHILVVVACCKRAETTYATFYTNPSDDPQAPRFVYRVIAKGIARSYAVLLIIGLFCITWAVTAYIYYGSMAWAFRSFGNVSCI